MSALFTARKPLTIFGARYLAGEPVPLDDLPPVLRRRLVEQKRVVPRAKPRGAASPAAIRNAITPDEELVVVTQEPAGTVTLQAVPRPNTCGWYGGRHRDGRPCGKSAKSLCRFHRSAEA